MSRKVDEQMRLRILQLRQDYHLTIAVIAERLGINKRTVSIYIKADKEGLPPYVSPPSDQ